MTLNILEKIALGTSGLTAIGIGAMILLVPHAFYASYGISLPANPSLLSELRAPAAGLTVLGVLMLSGIFRPAMVQIALATALTVFIAFPVGRFVSAAADGAPSSGIVGALLFEIAIAALCVFAFRRRLAGGSVKP
ncbi:DUF4345 domain-containing protein [Alphaproteobacteria bacterium GH1-50]|uniref:DUF4345 domain-containing protein n=1 Tax=Kangsaoukella pontilimi TaxID=2691042 RepID=A0A7C9MXG3_9RHOB|nr:DUF4345 domain-containing protein [Kangsaoukella pontilimi]MXQ08354.1 DUF4345 domain-containing protein [Kangsaoukella pontilimi]